MTPDQLERFAANRIQHMGYPDELSDAERWRRFDEDAQLVAATNDVLWERVHELEKERDEARREGKLWCAEVARLPSKQAAEAFGRVLAALAGGSDG